MNEKLALNRLKKVRAKLTDQKLDAFIVALDKTPILETVRSGVSGISRGAKSLHV